MLFICYSEMSLNSITYNTSALIYYKHLIVIIYIYIEREEAYIYIILDVDTYIYTLHLHHANH